MHLFLDEIHKLASKEKQTLEKKLNYLVSLGKKCLSNSKVFLKKKYLSSA